MNARLTASADPTPVADPDAATVTASGAVSSDSDDSDDAPSDAAPDGAALAFSPLAAAQPQASGPTQAQAAGAPLSATTADLAAQMAAKLSAGASRFQLQLNPEGLGRVDVQVTIGADREVRAQLSFADPAVANAIHARAAELQGALQQAGFSVPSDGMTFSAQPAAAGALLAGGGFTGGSNAGSGGGQSSGSGAGGGAALASAAFAGADGGTAANAYGARADSQLDIRI